MSSSYPRSSITLSPIDGVFPAPAAAAVLALVAGGGQSFKTIGGESIIGVGDIPISSPGSDVGPYIKSVNGVSPDAFGNVSVTVVGGSGGPALPTQVIYSTTVPLDGNKWMPQTAISGVVQYQIAGGAIAGGQCQLAIVANGTNVPTFSGIDILPGAAYNNTAGRLHHLHFSFDGQFAWVRVVDTGKDIGPSDTPPTQPLGPVAIAGAPGSVDVSWDTPSSSGSSPITGYIVQYAPAGSNSWVNA